MHFEAIFEDMTFSASERLLLQAAAILWSIAFPTVPFGRIASTLGDRNLRILLRAYAEARNATLR